MHNLFDGQLAWQDSDVVCCLGQLKDHSFAIQMTDAERLVARITWLNGVAVFLSMCSGHDWDDAKSLGCSVVSLLFGVGRLMHN